MSFAFPSFSYFPLWSPKKVSLSFTLWRLHWCQQAWLGSCDTWSSIRRGRSVECRPLWGNHYVKWHPASLIRGPRCLCFLLTARENIVTILVDFCVQYLRGHTMQNRQYLFSPIVCYRSHSWQRCKSAVGEKQRTVIMCLSPGSASSPPPPWIQGTRTQHHDPHGLHMGRQPPGLVVVVQMSFLMKVTMIFMLVLAPEKCVLYGAGDYDAYWWGVFKVSWVEDDLHFNQDQKPLELLVKSKKKSKSFTLEAIKVDVSEVGHRDAEPSFVCLSGQRVKVPEAVLNNTNCYISLRF